jgi:hypothetical protein
MALCPLFLRFGSRLQCFAFPVSLVLALLSYVVTVPLLFRVISFPETSPTVRHGPLSISFILSVCLSPLRPFSLTPLSSLPFPYPPIAQPPSPHSFVPVVPTSPVQYMSSPAVLLLLHQYTLPGARESTLVISLACGRPTSHLPHTSSSPIPPPDLIVEHFPGGS